ncbi:MAG: hypothetical protein A3E83_02290 [Gammaproteobacteria bacterium RIFCSPHIGHO2_12_FULL_41_20]|nr:MAG: hypothetical protein A3E83_02290 [Gammaproteobacteria bacterium RIFCSPHIGHO2_12_FULL_41_20]
MEELIQHLEAKIKTLMQTCQSLKHSNHQLQAGGRLILEENQSLLLKQERAISQIETMLSKLKTLENAP